MAREISDASALAFQVVGFQRHGAADAFSLWRAKWGVLFLSFEFSAGARLFGNRRRRGDAAFHCADGGALALVGKFAFAIFGALAAGGWAADHRGGFCPVVLAGNWRIVLDDVLSCGPSGGIRDGDYSCAAHDDGDEFG